MGRTTIKLSDDTKKRLDQAKKHKRETYEDVVIRLLDEGTLLKIKTPKTGAEALRLIRQLNENTRDQ